jgi:hypothetical protein
MLLVLFEGGPQRQARSVVRRCSCRAGQRGCVVAITRLAKLYSFLSQIYLRIWNQIQEHYLHEVLALLGFYAA